MRVLQRLSWERSALAAIVVAAAVVFSLRGFYEPDLWWHLAQGRENLSGRLVRANVFSFTYPEYRQQFTSWLFDTAAYAVWKVGGGFGLQVLQGSLIALTLGLVALGAGIRAPRWAVIATLLLGVFVLEPRAIPRPHLVSFAGLAACTLIVARAARAGSSRPLWWAVPLVVVWSNVHVECVFGVFLLAVFATSEVAWPQTLARREALRGLGAVTVCAAATLANPYGWGLHQYLYENLSVPQVLTIAELQPPYLPAYRAFFLYAVAAGALLFTEPRRLKVWEIAIFGAFVAIGVRYLRLTPLVWIVTAPMVAGRLTALQRRGVDRRALLVTAMVVAALAPRLPLRALATELRVGSGAVAPPAFFSERAMTFARDAGLGGPVFNSHNLGGYLAWMGYPDVRIFQDSRLQAYPPELFLAVLDASRTQRNWDVLVADVEWAVLSRPRPNDLSGVGRFPRSGWATVFWDEAVELVVRRGGKYAVVVAEHEYQLVRPDADPKALLSELESDLRERIRSEARRNHAENPDGRLALTLLCAMNEPGACDRLADVDRGR